MPRTMKGGLVKKVNNMEETLIQVLVSHNKQGVLQTREYYNPK